MSYKTANKGPWRLREALWPQVPNLWAQLCGCKNPIYGINLKAQRDPWFYRHLYNSQRAAGSVFAGPQGLGSLGRIYIIVTHSTQQEQEIKQPCTLKPHLFQSKFVISYNGRTAGLLRLRCRWFYYLLASKSYIDVCPIKWFTVLHLCSISVIISTQNFLDWSNCFVCFSCWFSMKY